MSLCAAGPLTTLLPWVFYVGKDFPRQLREHPLVKVQQKCTADEHSSAR